MRNYRAIFMGLGWCFWSVASVAQSAEPLPTVQDLYIQCKNVSASAINAECLFYIEGVGQMMAANGYILTKHLPKDMTARGDFYTFCLAVEPGSAEWPSGAAMIQSFNNWAAKHPEKWPEGQLLGVTAALSETWPCPPN